MSNFTAIKCLDETRPASRSFIYRVSDAAVLMRGLDADIHPVSAIGRALQLPFASRYRTLSLKSRHEPEPGRSSNATR